MALYANFVQASMSAHDLTLHFGWFTLPAFTEVPSGEVDVPVRPLAKVSIPLNLVRGLIRLLEAQVIAWEDAHGQPVPDLPTSVAPNSQDPSGGDG